MRLSPALFLSAVFPFFAHSSRAQQPSHPSPAADSAAPPSVVLREGSAVKLKLLHSLNSKTVIADDPLNFSLAEDVLVNGTTLVKAGAVAIGRVRKAKSART